MFDKLIAAVTDWPVLLQGVLGSALFWLILALGQRGAILLNAKYAAKSRKRRKAFLLEERLKYLYRTATDDALRSAIFSALLFRASRNAIRAAIWLTLGLIFSNLLPVLGSVGFIGCLYYLFAALTTVKGAADVEDVNAKLKELTDELNELNKA